MNLETFFEKFDLFADCPNAVQKMRELILELAVQGKLVEQDEGWLVDDSMAFPIPANWKWSSLSDLGEMSGGMTPSKADSSFWDGGVPWFSSKDIKFDELMTSELTISEKGLRETRLKLYPPGCLFIVARSGILKRTLPVAINRIPASVNQDLKVFQPQSDLDIRYIQLALKGLERRILTEYVKTGTTVQSLKYDEFEEMPIPLPPLAEQKRIVAKVDELMALCDALEAQQKEREAKRTALVKAALAAFAEAPSPLSLELLFHPSYAIDPADLRKSILTLAVQGKLVEQRGEEGNVNSGMLENVELPIGYSRRRKILRQLKRDVNLTCDVPTFWSVKTIQELYDLNILIDYADGNHGSLYPSKSEFGSEGVIFVTAKDIIDGVVGFDKCLRLNQAKAKILVKGWAKGGDVLLTHNATVGRVAKVDDDVVDFLLGTSVTFYRFNSNAVAADYMRFFMMSGIWQEQLEDVMRQTTRNQVSIQKQADFFVLIPPLAEQKRIVAKVDELMALVDRLEGEVKAAQETGARLLVAMVAELSGKAA